MIKMGDDAKKFKCQHCNREFNNIQGLSQHVKSCKWNHQDEVEKSKAESGDDSISEDQRFFSQENQENSNQDKE
jgi:predicted ATP-dependent serine protease